MMTIDNTTTEILTASQKWIEAFNKGDIRYCAEQYLEQAVMNARPMGEYKGRTEIYDFWQNFVTSTGATNLIYTDVNIEIIDKDSARLSAKWSMNVGKGFISNEFWVKKAGVWRFSEDDFTVVEQF